MSESRFESRLKSITQSPDAPVGMAEAMVYVHDTLKTASIIAKDVLGEQCHPESIIEIYALIDARLNRVDSE